MNKRNANSLNSFITKAKPSLANNQNGIDDIAMEY